MNMGIQASQLARAIEEVKRMLHYRLSDDPYDPNRNFPKDPEERKKIGCKIFLSCTSNMVSCGCREIIRFLVQHKLIDVLVISCGGIEEDFMKCLAPTYLGRFDLSGEQLRKKHINRIGNMILSNDNYCYFEDWFMEVLEDCMKLQDQGYHWTPSRMIRFMGKKINNPESIYYWTYKNNIPVFCPAFTDGSIGDVLYFNSFKNPGLLIDIVGDIRLMNSQTVSACKNGVVILGGSSPKHHVMNACLFSGLGAEYCVYINSGLEYDASDSGAPTEEAKSWGKISYLANPVKVFSEASLVFPILVKKSFYEEWLKNKDFYESKKGFYDDMSYWGELEQYNHYEGVEL